MNVNEYKSNLKYFNYIAMEYKLKKEDYRVEIRRKNINQRIINFRKQIFTEVQI